MVKGINSLPETFLYAKSEKIDSAGTSFSVVKNIGGNNNKNSNK